MPETTEKKAWGIDGDEDMVKGTQRPPRPLPLCCSSSQGGKGKAHAKRMKATGGMPHWRNIHRERVIAKATELKEQVQTSNTSQHRRSPSNLGS